jgi:hypothetical protein
MKVLRNRKFKQGGVYRTSTCLSYLNLFTAPQLVYRTSTCLSHLNLFTAPQLVYRTSTCLPHLNLFIVPHQMCIRFTISMHMFKLLFLSVFIWNKVKQFVINYNINNNIIIHNIFLIVLIINKKCLRKSEFVNVV